MAAISFRCIHLKCFFIDQYIFSLVLSDLLPPAIPEPEPLANLFNIRSTYVVTDPDDERLSSAFWQTSFEHDESDMIQIDLEVFCQQFCPDFNIDEELKKTAGMQTDDEITKPKKLK